MILDVVERKRLKKIVEEVEEETHLYGMSEEYYAFILIVVERYLDITHNRENIFTVKFKIQNTRACSIEEDTDDNEIHEIEVKESATYIKNGARYYKMVEGHGEYSTFPVAQVPR